MEKIAIINKGNFIGIVLVDNYFKATQILDRMNNRVKLKFDDRWAIIDYLQRGGVHAEFEEEVTHSIEMHNADTLKFRGIGYD
jgi:6-phosphofructokinase